MSWQNANTIGPRSYECGHCGLAVGPNLGYAKSGSDFRIWICSHCERPTFFTTKYQVPGPLPGSAVEHLPELVGLVYKEARESCQAGAYTSAVLTCRKLLMHVAVEKGADKDKSFLHYGEFLASKGYVPPDGKDWLAFIKDKGNEANHEIRMTTSEEAALTLRFVEMLLRLMFEFPGSLKKIAEPQKIRPNLPPGGRGS